jgi:CheY-like chemotaxis protein
MATILVVDDEAAIRNLILAVLEDEGYRAIGAASGVAALELAPTDPPDVVLLDLMMPVLDGRETLRRLRRLPVGTNVPVVIMSAAITAGTPVEGDHVAFLPKPFDLVALLDAVEAALARRTESASRRVGESARDDEAVDGRR